MKLNKGLRPPHRGCSCPACTEYHAKHGNQSINFKPYSAIGYSSLTLGFHNVSEKHDFFAAPDCDIMLGCSRAKVEATQHYLEAFGLIGRATLFESLSETQTCKHKDNLVPTVFGKHLLSRNGKVGADPYLESLDSLYLLHYHLTTSPMALAYYYLFNCFVPVSGYFSRDEATDSFEKWLAERTEKPPVKNTIRSHINTVLRTYAADTENMEIEDWADMLFIDLSLMGRTLFDGHKKEEMFYFNREADKAELGLSTEVFGYALLSFWDTHAPHSATLDMKTALWEAGSPLVVFKLTEDQFMEYIEKLQGLTGNVIELRQSVNLNQLYRTKPIDAFEFLKR